MAEKIGVSRQAVTKWESDTGLPDIENLKAIATLFNISIDELLDYKKEILGEIVLEEKYSLEEILKQSQKKQKNNLFKYRCEFFMAVLYYILVELIGGPYDWTRNKKNS